MAASAPPINSSCPYPTELSQGFVNVTPPPYPPQGGMYPSLNVGTSPIPASKVELHVSCRNLIDRDVFSKSDPMVVVFQEMRSGKIKHWKEFDRTETIQNCLDPDFVKTILIEYRFEELQKLKFEVYDCDSFSKDLRSHDFLGSMECSLGSLVGECGGRYEKELVTKDGKPQRGRMLISAEEVADSKEVISVQLRGRKLDKKDFFGLSDPFLKLYRCNEDNSFTAVHKTEVIKNTLNPTWKAFKIPVRTLCNGDYHRIIKIECYDWDNDGSHDFIGEFKTNLNEFKEKNTCSFELINPRKREKKKGYKNSGLIELLGFQIEYEPSFLDYVHAGMELCFSVAIDFTASNGDPSTPASLHYNNPYEPNAYLQALMAVGQICQDYDTDKLFPAFGFGAKVPPSWYTSHEFPLNASPDPNCFGINSIVQAYNQAVKEVRLYGPTNFSPVINSAVRIARDAEQHTPGKKYFILLILTDGIISDMDQTKEAIIHASILPISIIIVGVGSADFEAMEELDADQVKLSYKGNVAARDIVQFVPFRDFLGRSDAGEALAKAVLAEVPDQLKGFMKSKGIYPQKK